LFFAVGRGCAGIGEGGKGEENDIINIGNALICMVK
jgi:hypothetical protein